MEICGSAGQFGQGKSNGCSGNRKWKSLEGLGEIGPGNSYQKSYPGTGLSFGLVPFHFISISHHFTRLSTWGDGHSLTKSQAPKKIFRNSRYFSGHSYTNSGIIYL